MKWNAELYDDKHAFVFQFGENVLELLNAKPGERILDIGCGTGYLTQQIQSQGAEVQGTDYSPEMIAQAKANYPNVDFAVTDASNFKVDEPFNAIFSNAALHWIHNQDGLMQSVYQALKPGGRFVAEMGGKGNVQQLITATQQVLQQHGYAEQVKTQIWYFPSLGEYTSRLEQHGFRVTFAAHFDRKTPLQDGNQGVAKWIKMFGSQYFSGIPEQEQQQMLQEITSLLEPAYNENGQWYADYKRLRFIAIKEL
ncbi:methyltransferase domain-containing protein [Mucilaginibacter robiniae]|uniref:Methyltransferase domain-containing protein n=1 Tax=Mucilaginibacter robiniae TaxID=2728022 RepID=A0A7L5E121_9SPHI|nr:class I SAM-dependent methyltransferase [Mucilaginibacter robiniae]QJD96905.1 methyltransferase domain-containing protein [Mucilaginibacter robiniae]